MQLSNILPNLNVFRFTTRQNAFLKMVLKTAVFWKFCKTCKNTTMAEFTVKEVTVFPVTTFLNEGFCQI